MAIANIIMPAQHVQFEDWANVQAFLVPDLDWPSPAPSVSDWWDWAEVVYFYSSGKLNVPFPDRGIYPTKDHWRKWAAETAFQLLSLN